MATELSVPDGSKFHGFLTHTWRKDRLGRPNHDRVAHVHDALKAKGLRNWFDGERMQGDVEQQMIGGIDDSAVIVVFITKEYIDKVASGNKNDNCFKEFSYAGMHKADKMIAVPMEPCCLDTSTWTGKVSLKLGTDLYEANFASDSDDDFVVNVDKLYSQILRVAGQTNLAVENAENSILRPRLEPVDARKKNPLNAPGKWPFFISHAQADSKTEALDFFSSCKDYGKNAWLDVKMNARDEEAMEEGVQYSEKVLVIASPLYFTRPFCLKELEWAVKYEKPIVVAIAVAHKNNIGDILKTCPPRYRNIGSINWITLIRGDREYWDVGVKQIFTQAPKILKPLEGSADPILESTKVENGLQNANKAIKSLTADGSVSEWLMAYKLEKFYSNFEEEGFDDIFSDVMKEYKSNKDAFTNTLVQWGFKSGHLKKFERMIQELERSVENSLPSTPPSAPKESGRRVAPVPAFKFSVGDRVEARFKSERGAFYSGKVSAIRLSEGFYDIAFDDGDTRDSVPENEVRVKHEPTFNPESINPGDRFRFNPVSAMNYPSKCLKNEIVTFIETNSGNPPAHIKWANGTTYWVHWEDLIMVTKDDVAPDAPDAPIKFIFAVGDIVEARWKAETGAFYRGKIVECRESDGTYNVAFDDGDTRDCIPEKEIRRSLNFSIGAKVEARSSAGTGEFIYGTVSACHPSNMQYDIAFDDGNTREGVPEDEVRMKSTKEFDRAAVQPGDQFLFSPTSSYDYPSKCLKNEVVTFIETNDGTPPAHVKWASGTTHWVHWEDLSFVKKSSFDRKAVKAGDEFLFSPTSSYDYPSKCLKNEVVTFIETNDGTPPAHVKWANGTTYWVHWEDLTLTAKKTAPSEPEAAAWSSPDAEMNFAYAVGDTIEARWKPSTGAYYRGKIAACRVSDGLYNVHFDDGDTRDGVPQNEIRSCTDSSKAKNISFDHAAVTEGDQFLFNPTSSYDYPSKCLKNEKVTFLETNSGTPPAHVKWANGTTYWVEWEDLSPVGTKTMRKFLFSVGDTIEARWKAKTGSYYSGKISACRSSDGLYNVAFDDGDTRDGVPEGEIRKRSSSSTVESDSDSDSDGSSDKKKKKKCIIC